MNPRTYIIAEAGVNHKGDVDLARRLVDAAAGAGADAVKFQSFIARSLVRAGTSTAEYQKLETGQSDQLTMLQQL